MVPCCDGQDFLGGAPDWVTNKFDQSSKELRIIWRDLKRRFPPSSWSQLVDTSSGETIESRFTGLYENTLRNRQRIVGVFYLTVCIHRFNLNEGEGSRSSRFLTKYWQWCPSYYMCGQRHCIDHTNSTLGSGRQEVIKMLNQDPLAD